MARKKLEAKQLKELEKMVMDSMTPEDISRHFGIAVSSVHNYKKILREKGVIIPDVRGKRPSNIPPVVVKAITEIPVTSTSDTHLGEYMKITINNVVFYISAKAKTVSMDHNDLRVTF